MKATDGFDELDACALFRANASADLDGAHAPAGWEKHARVCGDCRAYSAELRRARRELALLACAPTADLWSRIEARAPRGRRWTPLVWRAAALLVGLLGTLAALLALERARPAPTIAADRREPWASLAPLRDPTADLDRAAEVPEFQLLALLTTPREDER
jgi:hypothetical protein